VRYLGDAHHKRLFVRCVGDDVVSYGLERQGLCGEERSLVSLVRKRHQLANGVQNVFTYTPSSQRIILNDKFPDVGDVLWLRQGEE
jgi:hypothetical protein